MNIFDCGHGQRVGPIRKLGAERQTKREQLPKGKEKAMLAQQSRPLSFESFAYSGGFGVRAGGKTAKPLGLRTRTLGNSIALALLQR